MPSTSLDEQSSERKQRLTQLRTLKRKAGADGAQDGSIVEASGKDSQTDEKDTSQYLSGRNYDSQLGMPKLGSSNAPSAGQETLETRAAEIQEVTKTQQEDDEKLDVPVDLFSLQPKSPNWDLKRDLQLKLEKLKPRTDRAIATLVRDKVLKSQEASGGPERKSGPEENLAEAVRRRETEAQSDYRHEQEIYATTYTNS